MPEEKQQTGTVAKGDRRASSSEVTRTLSETRDALRHYETSVLTDVARTLSDVAESLAQTTGELAVIGKEEWVEAEGARIRLKRTKKQFERIAPWLPRHYVSERGILYNIRELDEWVMDR